MARLEIRLLGPFHVIVDGEPAAGFESDSTRALLALLASEPGRAWSRPTVAEMLWPDRPPGAALSNLRHVLSGLRKVLSDSPSHPRFVQADRNKVSLIASPDVWIDAMEFEQFAATPLDQEGAAAAWERAVDLWRGVFLEDVNARAGADWEEWQVVTGERLRRRLVGTLRALATHHERAGDWARAIPFAHRLVGADVYEERAHRQLMRMLAATGEAAQALAAFEDLRKRLDAEFATEPAVETAALAERIRAGTVPAGSSEFEIAYPDFLTGTRSLPAASPFIGRERELGQLETHLESALEGHGRVVLIAGEAGTGKTLLATEFARRAMSRSDLLVANGRCNAYGGLGDPYLPFREVLGLLTGDVESGFAAGTIGREQATRLWEAIPHSARLVWDRGSSLVGVMVDGVHLVARCRDAVPGAEWLAGLQQRAEAVVTVPLPPKMQPALFDEYTAVLAGLAATHPTVLVVDDLQWGDHGSIALLWHLARRLEGPRLLILGLYRPEEIHDEHPLRQLLVELQTNMPEGTLELGSDREFIDAFLDSEPNQLDTDFRNNLFSYTDGHPLLTVEMVRGMQERAELRRNRAGLWVTQEPLDWGRIPTRVEAVIAQRIGRLPDGLEDDLMIAAVQGEEFLGETVAAVRGDDTVADRLRLESRLPHRLLAPSGAFRIEDRLVTAYRFRHILFQRYLYDQLSKAERLRLHEDTGRALEGLYRESTDPPVVDLAHHFDEAGLVEPAIAYLQRAGQRAFRMSANEEAFRLLQRALSLLMTLPESLERDQRELELLVSLSAAAMAVRGYTAPESVWLGQRVRELCGCLEPSPTAALALSGLCQVLTLRALHREAKALGRDVVAIGRAIDDSGVEMVGHYALGYMDIWLGNLPSGWRSLQRACQLYDQDKHGWVTHALGMAIGPEALAWSAICALHRGYPEQAFRLGDESMAIARKLGHPFTLCHTLGIGGSALRMMCGDYAAASLFAEEAAAIAEREHFPFWVTCLAIHLGAIAGHLGDPDWGISEMRRGFDAWDRMGVQSYRGYFYSHLADFERMQGRPSRGLEIMDGELKTALEVEEALSEAYVRLQIGSLEAALGHTSPAIDRLEEATVNARRIGSRLLELQAATGIAELHLHGQRPRDAASVLEPVLSQFTEGLETPYLIAARSVLASL